MSASKPLTGLAAVGCGNVGGLYEMELPDPEGIDFGYD
jgi:hypothetical protein